MRKMFVLLPMLLLSVQPKPQPTTKSIEKKADSLVFKIETDTMLLSYVSEKLIEETKEIEALELRKKELKRQLKALKRKQRFEKKMIEQVKNDLEKFNKRGL